MNHAITLAFVFFVLTPGRSQTGAEKMANSQPVVITGAERLLTDQFFSLIEDRSVALVTNHTGVLADGRHLADVLHRHPRTRLTLLFGPEHGIRGDADAHVADGRDTDTGLPVISLYGKVRKPTSEMLKGIDVIIFDIQDIGARFYTYITTMTRVLEAAAEHDIPYIVLDRPNAIGGLYVDGPVGGNAGDPVVSPARLPVAHGMTVGELAQMFNGERRKSGLQAAELTVIPMLHYERPQWFDDTGLPWIKPSPNMLTLTTATVYPGTCMLEGTNVSEGRGTLEPFEHIGATWINGKALAAQLNGYALSGVRFTEASFMPDSVVDGIRIYPPKFVGQRCQSARLHVTDRNTFAPVKAGVYILHALMTLYPKQFEFRETRLDKLLGSSRVRQQLLEGRSPREIITQWEDELEAFRRVRHQYLIYK